MEKEVEDLLVHLDWIKKDLKLDIPEGKTEIEVEKGFVLIQNKLFGEIQEIKTAIDTRNGLLERGANRKKIIECNASINKRMRTITTDFQALKDQFMKDDKKRINKMTPEEKKERIEVINNLSSQIQTIASKYEEEQKNMSVPTDDLCSFGESSFNIVVSNQPANQSSNTEQKKELISGSIERDISGIPTSSGPELTDAQAQNLVQIERNQQEFDQMLEIISNGLTDLQDIANNMNDEIKKQTKMLDQVETTMDQTQAHLDATHKKLHNTLQASKRGGDKFCVDLILILIIVFVGVIIVNILL